MNPMATEVLAEIDSNVEASLIETSRWCSFGSSSNSISSGLLK